MTDPRRAGGAHRRLGGSLLVALSASVVFSVPAFAAGDESDGERLDEVQQEQGTAQDDKDAVDDQIVDLGGDLDDTSVELIEADRKLSETNTAVEDAEDAEEAAQQELVDAKDEAERIAGELKVAKANEERIEASLDDNADKQEDSKEAVGAIARESYKSGGVGNLALTLDALAGEGDAVEDMAMARTVLRVQDNAMGRLSTQQADEVNEQDRLAGVRRDVVELQDDADASVIRKRTARDEAKETTGELERLQTQQQADRDALDTEKETFEGQLADAQTESDDLEAELVLLAEEKHGLKTKEEADRQRAAQEKARKLADERAGSSPGSNPPSENGTSKSKPKPKPESPTESSFDSAPSAAPRPSSGALLSPPTTTARTSEFGYRFHPILRTQKLHAGTDFGGACGTPVRAAADGSIVSTPRTRGGGNQIVIDHGVQRGVNLTTTYKHLSRYALRSGKVTRGQVVGYIGTTGLSTGCHLHFETRENGIPVNPTSWL